MPQSLRVCTGGQWIGVATLADASAAVRADIERRGIGASEWYGGDAGRVHDTCGVLVARVSYNGRVWDPAAEGHEIIGAALTEAR